MNLLDSNEITRWIKVPLLCLLFHCPLLVLVSSIMAAEVKARFTRCIQTQLLSLQLCSGDEEANAIAEAIADQEPFEESNDYLEMVTASFGDYFDDMSESEIRNAVAASARDCWGDNSGGYTNNAVPENDSDESVHSQQDDEVSSQHDSDDDDGEMLGSGECELCERTIKLTRHHLIPKSTWPRMKKRLWNAASDIESFHAAETGTETKYNLGNKLQKSGFNNPNDLPATITHASIRNYLSQVIAICRPCHSAVHRMHDEWQLATEFYTTEKLLECDEVRKFAKWQNKQKPGKYAVK